MNSKQSHPMLWIEHLQGREGSVTAAFDSGVKGSDLESEAVASDLEVLGQKVSKVVEER